MAKEKAAPMQSAEYSEIPIRNRQGEVRAVVKVDPADVDSLLRHRWHLAAGRYAARSERRNGTKRMVYMHRQIAGIVDDPDLCIDHINRDPLDNRRANLRVCTHAENMQNLGSFAGSISGHRNVTWSRQHGKWMVGMRLGGRMRHVGLFDDEEEAAQAASAFRAKHLPFSQDALVEKVSVAESPKITGSAVASAVAASTSGPSPLGFGPPRPIVSAKGSPEFSGVHGPQAQAEKPNNDGHSDSDPELYGRRSGSNFKSFGSRRGSA